MDQNLSREIIRESNKALPVQRFSADVKKASCRPGCSGVCSSGLTPMTDYPPSFYA